MHDGIPGSWLYGKSDSGYMDGDLFLTWFKEIFLLNCGRDRPVLLIMDNHDSHLTLPLVETARANDVVLLGMPAHTTHILQPLDVKVSTVVCICINLKKKLFSESMLGSV